MKTATVVLTLLFIGASAAGDDAPPTAAPSTTAPSTTVPPTSAPATQPSTEPSVRSQSAEEMLKRMLHSGASTARPLQPTLDGARADTTSGRGAVAPTAPVLNVLREGSLLVDRVGRLNHGNDNALAEFTFDSDGKTMKDPPVLILPNLKLMAMENAISSANRDLRFRITGMVTEYRGRNYVLLDKVVVVPDPAQQF